MERWQKEVFDVLREAGAQNLGDSAGMAGLGVPLPVSTRVGDIHQMVRDLEAQAIQKLVAQGRLPDPNYPQEVSEMVRFVEEGRVLDMRAQSMSARLKDKVMYTSQIALLVVVGVASLVGLGVEAGLRKAGGVFGNK